MLFTDFMNYYIDFFGTVFSFVVPLVKLFAIIVGVRLLVDIGWIVHQIRTNAEGYQNEGAE